MQAQHLRSFERLLIDLDSGVWSAISRVVLGSAIPFVFRALSADDDSIWAFPAFFVVVLIGLRVVPAGLRLVLPFSAEAQETWAERRALAKRYDSYQWQKLFWFGLGMLLYIIMVHRVRFGELAVTGLCLIGGGAGQLIWRKASSRRHRCGL